MKPDLLSYLDVSAASGLVHHEGFLYVVADDALELLRVDLQGERPTPLALSPAARRNIPKKEKPDFEALMVSGGSLVAIGSGSSELRRRAVALDVIGGSRRTIELTPLYAALAERIHELNIEGAVARGPDVFLAQRGNGARHENALVRLDRVRFENDLAEGVITAACLREVIPVSLGALGEVPLSLTDLCLGPSEKLIFTAAAEATDDPYLDGDVAGSIIATIDLQGQVDDRQRVVVEDLKLEGVCWLPGGELRLVADPDDSSARAPLFGLSWPR